MRDPDIPLISNARPKFRAAAAKLDSRLIGYDLYANGGPSWPDVNRLLQIMKRRSSERHDLPAAGRTARVPNGSEILGRGSTSSAARCCGGDYNDGANGVFSGHSKESSLVIVWRHPPCIALSFVVFDPQLGIVACQNIGKAFERIQCLWTIPDARWHNPIVPAVLEVNDISAEDDGSGLGKLHK